MSNSISHYVGILKGKFKKSYWIKSGIYSLGSKLSTLFLGFGSFYFLIRHLSPAQFGTWALFLTVTAIIEASRNGLVQNALIKLVYTYPDERSKVITATWFINSLYSIVIYTLMLVFAGLFSDLFKSPDLQAMFMYYGVTLLFLIPFSQFNYIQQASFSFGGIFWSTMARQGSFFISILIIYFSDLNVPLIWLVILHTLSTFFGMLVAYICARKYLIFKFDFDLSIMKKVFQFGKYVMGTNISSLIYKTTDQFLVGFHLNTSLVAFYNSAIRISNLIEYPTTSIAEVVYPKSAANFQKEGESSSKNFFEKSVGLTMALTVPVIIIIVLLADYIILIIAGPLYAQSADILRITILFGIFSPFWRQFGTAMDSSGRPHINFIVLSSSVIINVIINFVAIKNFGIMGAAWGTLCSYIIISAVCYILMAKIFRIEMLNIFNYMFGYFSQGFGFLKKLVKTRAVKPSN